MRSRHVETKSTLILCPTVSDPGKYVCVDDHLLQLMDQLLDLGLGAKSWPAIGLHPVHRVGDCDLRQGGGEADAAVPHAAVLALGLLRIFCCPCQLDPAFLSLHGSDRPSCTVFYPSVKHSIFDCGLPPLRGCVQRQEDLQGS